MFRPLAALSMFLCAALPLNAQILPEEAPDDSGYLDPGYYTGDTSGGASTYEEGVQRGFADVVRSDGLRRLATSEAMKNVEDARRAYIDNRLKATQTYYDMKRMNNDYRASQRSQPLSFEGYVRLARAQAPDRLSVSQLDPFTGNIAWPAILRDPRYAQDRLLIETLYLLNILQADIDLYVQNDYLAAKKFVESLRHEAVLARN